MKSIKRGHVATKVMMQGLVAGAASLLFCTASWSASPAKMDVDDIRQCMKGNFVDRGTLRDFRIQATDEEGNTDLVKAKLYWYPLAADKSRINIRVTSPKDLAGSAFLLRSDSDGEDVHVYLPALKTVRRISGQDRSQTLWGTDFSVDDVKQLQGLLVEGETTRMTDEEVDGRKSFVLTTKPSKGTSRFEKITSYVDQTSCLLLKSVFFESANKPAKILAADTSTLLEVDVRSQKVWLLFGYMMRNLNTGTSSALSMGGVDFLYEELPKRAFEPDDFYKDF